MVIYLGGFVDVLVLKEGREDISSFSFDFIVTDLFGANLEGVSSRIIV